MEHRISVVDAGLDAHRVLLISGHISLMFPTFKSDDVCVCAYVCVCVCVRACV